MKKSLTLFCFLVFAFQGYAQSVYTYDIKKDIVIGSLSFAIMAAPFFVANTPGSAPGALAKEDVNPFDRALMFPYNKPLDLVSDLGVYSLLVLPGISVLGNITEVNALITYPVMYAEAVFLTFGTKDLLKNAVIRYRPYMYAEGIPAGRETDYYNSFPSGSTALAFLSAGFLSATFSAEYPESPWKIPLISGIYTLAGGIAAARIISGSHFLSDVLAGAAIGSLYGWLIPALHKRQNGAQNITLYPLGNGLAVSLRY